MQLFFCVQKLEKTGDETVAADCNNVMFYAGASVSSLGVRAACAEICARWSPERVSNQSRWVLRSVFLLREFFTRSGYAKTGLRQQVEVVFFGFDRTGDLKLVLEPHIERCAGENDDTFLARAFHEKYLAAIFLQDNFTTTPLSAQQQTRLSFSQNQHTLHWFSCVWTARVWHHASHHTRMNRTVTRTRWPMRKRTDHRWQRSPQLRPGDY